MESRQLRRRPLDRFWLAILASAVLLAPGADLSRFENHGQALATEPVVPPDKLTVDLAEPSPTVGFPNFEPSPPDGEKMSLAVVDEQGAPVPKFEMKLWIGDQGSSKWDAGSEGKISRALWSFARAEAIDVTLRAEGYASALRHFAGPDLKALKAGEATMVMRRGEEVQLSFRLPPGMTWPDGLEPELYYENMTSVIRSLWQPHVRRSYANQGLSDFNMLAAHAAQPAAVTFRLATDSPPFRVAIHSAGFLRFFERGPFTLADVKNGKLEIEIEKPAALDVQFDPGSAEAENLPFKSETISVMRKIPGASRPYMTIATSSSTQSRQALQLADLAAGDYKIDCHTKAKAGVKNISDNPAIRTNPGVFSFSKNVSLAAGQTERVDIPYTPFDPESFKGDRNAVIHILKPDGSPPSSQTVTLISLDEHYGPVQAFSGSTSESGTVTVTGITDRKHAGATSAPYIVSFAGQRLGRFSFSDEPATPEFTFRLPPVVGDLAPDIALTNLSTGAVTRLSDFRGKVVCLEFWATWCGPCQEPVRKMNQMVVDRRDAWKDRVVIVPLSIDDAAELVTGHVASRGWKNLEFFWSSDNGVGGWESPASLAFGIHSVPTSLLIDRDGKILWRGHPAPLLGGGASLEQRIEKAIEE